MWVVKIKNSWQSQFSPSLTCIPWHRAHTPLNMQANQAGGSSLPLRANLHQSRPPTVITANPSIRLTPSLGEEVMSVSGGVTVGESVGVPEGLGEGVSGMGLGVSV